MKHFTIENETNNIVIHGTAKEADALPNAERFSNEGALAKLAAEWPAARMVEIWNSLPGETQVKNFKDRTTAASRIWKAIQNLGETAPIVEEPAPVPEEAPVAELPETARPEAANTESPEPAGAEPVAPQSPDVAPVGDDESAASSRRQVLQQDDRHFLHPELLGSEQTCVPGDHIIIGADQDRVCPAPTPHRSRDAGNLRAAVRSRVIGPRNQASDRPALDLDINVDRNLGGSMFGRQNPIVERG